MVCPSRTKSMQRVAMEKKSAKSKLKCAATLKASPKVQKRVASKARLETNKENSSSVASKTSPAQESSNVVCPTCLTNIEDATDTC